MDFKSFFLAGENRSSGRAAPASRPPACLRAGLKTAAAGLAALLCLPSFGGAIQYKSKASPIRYDLAAGSFVTAFPFSYKPKSGEAVSFFNPSFGASLYFPETDRFLPESLQEKFVFGAAAGAQGGRFANICERPARAAIYRLGFKGRFFYSRLISPSVEYGLAKAACGLPWESPSSLKLKSYVSFGLNLSWKVFSPSEVYGLDQAYGLNDISFSGQCLYFPKSGWQSGGGRPLSFCEAGLAFLF